MTTDESNTIRHHLSQIKYFIFNIKERKWFKPAAITGLTTNLEDAGEFTFGECRKLLIQANLEIGGELKLVMVPMFSMDYMTPL